MGQFFSYINIIKFSRKNKIHFFINIGVGIIIAVLFHFIEYTDWGENALNRAFDYVITKEASKSALIAENTRKVIDPRISKRIVFVDIDHQTYKQWGRPLITPRDKIALIMESAYKGGAKVIVPDILFEDKDCCSPSNDSELRRVLQDMIEQKVPTKVIFPMRIGHDGEPIKNLFDDLIDKSSDFYLAIPNISSSAYDRVVRYWMPYAEVRNSDGREIIWNMSLLTAVTADENMHILKTIEEDLLKKNPKGNYTIPVTESKNIRISANREDIYNYRIRFLLVPRNTLENHPGGNLFEEVNKFNEFEYADFRDKIVIIGNSSPDAWDQHPTPIGNMAGMYIIGNAINTISLGMQPAHPPFYINMLIELIVIIIAAYFFLYFTSFLAQILVSLILILTLGVISYYYFVYTGVFLNFIFAVIGMSFHETASDIERLIENRGINIH